jgi:hypothetical protein
VRCEQPASSDVSPTSSDVSISAMPEIAVLLLHAVELFDLHHATNAALDAFSDVVIACPHVVITRHSKRMH